MRRLWILLVFGGRVVIVQRVAVHHDYAPLTTATTVDEHWQDWAALTAVEAGDAASQHHSEHNGRHDRDQLRRLVLRGHCRR